MAEITACKENMSEQKADGSPAKKKIRTLDDAPNESHEKKGAAQLVVLAQDCDNGDYVKLVEGLCKEKSISLLKVPKKEQLGEWCGLCKIDEEGNPTKIVKCSCAAIRDYGEETEGLAVLMEHLKSA